VRPRGVTVEAEQANGAHCMFAPVPEVSKSHAMSRMGSANWDRAAKRIASAFG
jgi:hypothetical protein